jgi:hypothetical protein
MMSLFGTAMRRIGQTSSNFTGKEQIWPIWREHATIKETVPTLLQISVSIYS